jgi:rhodanese-related sulfurtransferase
MSQTETVTPEEAQALLGDGYAYVDVRNQVEFEQGHPAGAFNVPITLHTDFGPEPNEQFVEVIGKHFALDAKLIVGCATGVRSSKAARLLSDAGFSNVVDQKAGFVGSRDPFGRKSPGWRDSGLPVETGQPDGRSYEALTKDS